MEASENAGSCERPTSATEPGSSPGRQLDETDRQILEWAGKLELESVDLREKADALLGLLQQRCSEVAASQQGLETWKQTVGAELSTFKADVVQALEEQRKAVAGEVRRAAGARRTPPPDMERFAGRIIKSFETRQQRWFKEFQATQDVLYNVTVQLDRATDVLGSVSRDLQALSARQAQTEAFLARHVHELGGNVLPSTPPPSMAPRQRASPPGPAARTRDKAHQTRYLIPWEDISDQEL
ncbi:FACL124Wp [Eremothecium gossypii FDAG1]|nr:FACL124Wp [Eremothecium gossypii FDAG1]